MQIDYSKGRYVVTDPNGNVVGRIDCDEFVRSGSKLLYRIDGGEFYDMSGELLGAIDDGAVITASGSKRFAITAE